MTEQIPGVLEVRDCPHGRGVFALKDFAKGELVAMTIGGDYVATPKSTRSYALRLGEHLYWDEAPKDSPGYWSNFLDHNDDANCRFVDFDKRLPGAKLTAIRAIKRNQELSLNYRDYYPTNPVF
jgi:hypothetical protein